jgi:uncharacterized lipoprotein YddW (UPF0748 family)
MHPKRIQSCVDCHSGEYRLAKAGADPIEKQKADFIEILDTYKKLNYNAVIVQIRSVGDAFYPSKLAPWSKYLTGKEGRAPSPY